MGKIKSKHKSKTRENIIFRKKPYYLCFAYVFLIEVDNS